MVDESIEWIEKVFKIGLAKYGDSSYSFVLNHLQ
jgi:hypothetical protein